ncbi:MAG: FtsX-like permease family protein, partial [Blastocatellia bacterium]
QKAQEVNPGFKTDNILSMQIDLGREGYTGQRGLEFHRQLLDKLKSVGSIDSACIASNTPFAGGLSRSVFIEGQEPGVNGRGVLVQTDSVGEGFFQTLGITILRGRDFGSNDKDGAPKTAVINETMAADFWPGQDAVGKRFKFFGDEQYREVVGIARNAKYNSLVENKTPFVYLPMLQEYTTPIALFVHSKGDTSSVTADVREQVRSLDAGVPLLGITTLKDVVNQSLQGQKTGALLLSVFGGLALLLAAIGLYGVTSYSVAQRTREIGIRMAIGADRHHVVRMVLGQGMVLVSIGLAVGAVAAFVVMRLIATLLFGVSAADPETFAITICVLAVVALMANYFPARKATKVDPVVALRYQ